MTGRPPLDSLHVPRMDATAAGCCMEALQHDCLTLPETPKGTVPGTVPSLDYPCPPAAHMLCATVCWLLWLSGWCLGW